jgi:hypothetical protein
LRRCKGFNSHECLRASNQIRPLDLGYSTDSQEQLGI